MTNNTDSWHFYDEVEDYFIYKSVAPCCGYTKYKFLNKKTAQISYSELPFISMARQS